MHAVSRDTSQFHSSCLYLQLDGEQSLSELTGTKDGAAATEVMDTGGDAVVEKEGATDDQLDGGEESDDGADEADEPLEEVRLVPLDAKEEDGGADGALEALFNALSDGAALNPDDDDDDDDADGDA